MKIKVGFARGGRVAGGWVQDGVGHTVGGRQDEMDWVGARALPNTLTSTSIFVSIGSKDEH